MSFKKYISRKEVMAEPMNELQAVELGYARPNDDNHEWREGYHVLYPDGYHSWCPKQQFEATNHLAETHIDRMVIELDDLTEKANKLGIFIHTEKFGSLDATMKRQLLAQHGAMIAYLYILDERLGYTRWLENTKEQLNADGPHKCACDMQSETPEEDVCCDHGHTCGDRTGTMVYPTEVASWPATPCCDPTD
jgi:hypothetical protein